MRLLSRLLVVTCMLLLVTPDARAVTLVKDGQPVATIVVSKAAQDAKPYKPGVGVKADPAQKAQLAAQELQRCLEKMSGVKLPIVNEDEAVKGAVVLVGASRKTEPLKLNIPTGMTSDRKEEGYVIVAKGDTLVLAGNDVGPYQGTFFAVSEFLNRQGVRWFMPSAFGEIIPRKTTVEFKDLEFRDKPDFIIRAWNGNLAPELREDDAMWRLRSKLVLNFTEIIAIPGDSYLRQYLPDKELLKTHPEYFAKHLDGTINEHMVNLTHPEVPKLVAAKVKARIVEERKKDPTFNSLGFAPDDGIPMDLSKETMATNAGFTDLVGREGVITELSVSEEWFRFMNKVVEEVAREYPDFVITTNGYANRNMPPEGVKLHPNMGVMFAAIWCDLLHAYDDPKSWQSQLQGEMLKRWGQICSRTFVYNYNFPMLVTGLSPMPMTRKIARNTPLLKKWNIIGFEDEQTFPWMAHGITTFYLRAKLYWHAGADAKAILDDYFATWYGPAAKPSQAYWDAIEEALESTPMLGHEDRVLPYVYSDALIESLEKHQRGAEAAATEEPYKTRVRVDRLILDHLKAYMALNRAEFLGQWTEAIKQADIMFKLREDLNKISAFFIVPESKDPGKVYFSGAFYWNLIQRKEHYEKMLAMTTGKTGDLIAQSPQKVKFKLDPADVGRLSRWYDPGFDRSSWRLIDTTAPFYIQGDNMLDKQGVPYIGYMWYVFEFDVPKSAIGKPIRVHAPIVVTESWLWANGEYCGRKPYREAYERPQTLDVDVTPHIKPGKNVIGVRVFTSLSRIQVSEGFQGPLFLYAPKPEAAKPATPAGK